MRRAIAWRVITPDEILAIAEEERGRMRKSYQHDDFVALCSELVNGLLELRRKAEAEGASGIRNTALLDARHPGWRDELPIYVPPEDEALVAELLTGLLDEKMAGLTTEGVEVRRYLVKRNGEWLPAASAAGRRRNPAGNWPASRRSRARAIQPANSATILPANWRSSSLRSASSGAGECGRLCAPPAPDGLSLLFAGYDDGKLS